MSPKASARSAGVMPASEKLRMPGRSISEPPVGRSSQVAVVVVCRPRPDSSWIAPVT